MLNFKTCSLFLLLLTGCSQQPRTAVGLYDEATQLVTQNYHGYSTADLPALAQVHRKALLNQCQASCTVSQAEQQLRKFLQDLGDLHTHYLAPLPSRTPSWNKGGADQTHAHAPSNLAMKPAPVAHSATPRPVLPVLTTEGLPAGMGVLRLPDLGIWEEVSHGVHDRVREAQQQGLHALVLDLRDNPGGFVWEMLSAVTAFVEHAELINAYAHKKEHLVAQKGKVSRAGWFGISFGHKAPAPALWQGKLVVLVNGRTASAAEYLAYILQQQHRATVVGEPTRGMLNTTADSWQLSNGGELNISVTQTLNGAGEPYPAQVLPDVQVKNAAPDAAQDPLLQKALQVLAASN